MVLSNKRRRKHRKTKRITKRRKTRQSGGTTHQTVYPPDSIKNHISHVVYVNLDSRTDRKAQMENELKVFNPEQIHRIPGIVPDSIPTSTATLPSAALYLTDVAHRNVALAKAHLNAVKLAKQHNWDNTLFLEDDSIWANIDKAYPAFEALIKNPYDAIMLGSHHAVYDTEFRIESATSGAAYLLHHSHYDIFIERLQAMIDSFVPGVTTHHALQTDLAVFGPLQKEYKWFAVVPALMIQLPGHSDRENKRVNFTEVETKG